jgi:hypothetical protein
MSFPPKKLCTRQDAGISFAGKNEQTVQILHHQAGKILWHRNVAVNQVTLRAG